MTRRDYHAVEPVPTETILRADGTRLVISVVLRRTELGYVVFADPIPAPGDERLSLELGEGRECEIFRGGNDWLAVSDMFEYEGVAFYSPEM